MYLSRIELDEKNALTRRDLTNMQRYHGWLEHCFPDEFVKHVRTRKLWRIDTLQGHKYVVLLSSARPDLYMLEKYGVHGTAKTQSYDTLLSKVQVGQRFRFRITLNPTRCNSNGSRVPDTTIDRQKENFAKKAVAHGFSLDDCECIQARRVPLSHKGAHMVHLYQTEFEGILQVQDADLFRSALLAGIGHEKAYGCGLLTIMSAN